MKKAGGSKDRLNKTGNSKKRASSGNNGGIANGGPGGTGFELPEQNVVIWPEWSDAEVAAEKWTTKHAFEDPEGLILLPRSLRHQVEGFKRPTELSTDAPVGVLPQNTLESLFSCQLAAATTNASTPNSNVVAPAEETKDEIPNNTATSEENNADPSNVANIQPVTTENSLDAPQAAPETNPTDNSSTAIPQEINVELVNSDASTPNTNDDSVPIETENIARVASETIIDAPSNTTPIEEPQDTVDQEDELSEQEYLSTMSKLIQANKHLLCSDLMRSILATLHFMHELSRQFRSNALLSEEFTPYDNIYPKGKDGLPSFNPSGKYAVKLYWLGQWRKVTVDDRVPVDAQGRPLLISSPNLNELWPLILCKALVKVASTSYKEQENAQEYGDFDIFNALRGWLPERFVLNAYKPSISLWNSVHQLNIKNVNPAISNSFNIASNLLSLNSSVGAALSNNKPNGAGSAGKQHSSVKTDAGQGSFVTIFAYRDGEENLEKLDLSIVPMYFRVMEIRDAIVSPNSPGTPKEKTIQEAESSQGIQKLVKIKSYFNSGSNKLKRTPDVRNMKTIDAADIGVTNDDPSEYWMLYSDFCRSFKHINIYHNPTSFKFVKSVLSTVDPSKLNESLRILPVLYSPDPNKENTVMITLHTCGRYAEETLIQGTCAVIEKWEWKTGADILDPAKQKQPSKSPVMRLSTNSCLTSLFYLESGRHSYRFSIDCPTAYQITVWSKEEFCLEDESKYFTEKLGLHVKDVDEVFPAQPAGSWFILFKHIFHLPMTISMNMSAVLYTPESIQPYVCLRMFDNDGPQPGSTVEVPQVFYMLKQQYCLANKNGYTLLADCRLPVAKPASKWKLRIITESLIPIFAPEKPLDGISVKPNVHDFEDIYIPNKHNILFRYLIKVKDAAESQVSMQLQFNLPFVPLKLQLFDHDNEIFSAKGKGVVVVHSTSIYANQPEGDGVAAPPTKSSGGKESKQAANMITTIATLSLPPKHKFVLQASIEPMELSKFMSLQNPGTSEANRPISRGVPKTGSGKKKRSVAGITAGGTAALPEAVQLSGTAGNVDPAWKLRLISTDTTNLMVAKDTEKEDRYKALKDSWEQQQPGRASKAREARDAYVKQAEQGLIRPITFGLYGGKEPCKPWTILKHGHSLKAEESPSQHSTSKRPSLYNAKGVSDSFDESQSEDAPTSSPVSTPSFNQSVLVNWPPTDGPKVLSKEDIQEREEQRTKALSKSVALQEALKQDRVKDKEKRLTVRQHQTQVLEERWKENEVFQKEDAACREAFKQCIQKQIEEALARKAQLALAAAGLTAEALADDANDKDKKKKAAGVKAK